MRGWVETNVPELMRDAMMPGFAIALVGDGETIHADACGARDAAKNLSVTSDTLFGIGSIAKSLVAIAILKQRGRANSALTIRSRNTFHPSSAGPGEQILIRHFLMHSPGFPNLATSTVLLNRGLGEDTGVPMSSAAGVFRLVDGAKDEVVFAPGEHFSYDNAAWRILGAVIQWRHTNSVPKVGPRSLSRGREWSKYAFDADLR